MNIGSQVLFRQGFKLVRGVVIDIDLTFITLRIEYKKDKYCDIKVKRNSDSIINGIDVEAFTNRNNFMI